MTTEQQEADKRVPVTILTGFLGAGKTTLLNNLVSAAPEKRLAIIVNEFGDVGIDADLINSGGEEPIELSNGCICCVIRGDLIRTLRKLFEVNKSLDGILIETTGLANPSPIIQTLILDPVIAAHCRINSIVCVTDAKNIFSQLKLGDEAENQIAVSDCIILNKTNEATVSVTEIEHTLELLNPFAELTKTNRAQVDANYIFEENRFDLEKIEFDNLVVSATTKNNHINDKGIKSVSLVSGKPMDETLLYQWLQDLLEKFGANILRTKGIFNIAGKNEKLVVQAVNMMIEGDYFKCWDDTLRLSRIVFVGRRLDEELLREGFEKCHHNITT